MSYETVDFSQDSTYVFKRDSITQLMRDQQAKRLRDMRASTDPRSKLVQSAYVKAKREARAKLQAMIDEQLFKDTDADS
jgi:hypothetical protein